MKHCGRDDDVNEFFHFEGSTVGFPALVEIHYDECGEHTDGHRDDGEFGCAAVVCPNRERVEQLDCWNDEERAGCDDFGRSFIDVLPNFGRTEFLQEEFASNGIGHIGHDTTNH